MSPSATASTTLPFCTTVWRTAACNSTAPPGDEQSWYLSDWTVPAAYLIIVYCITSACTMLLLMCHGYMDWHLNVSGFSVSLSEHTVGTDDSVMIA
jgi:hypothetical protein